MRWLRWRSCGLPNQESDRSSTASCAVLHALLESTGRRRDDGARKLPQAAQAYRESLAIRKALAAGEPGNIQWQHDLTLSYVRVAALAERQKDPREARTYWKQAFDVLSGIDKRGLHLSPQERQVLEALSGKVRAEAH